MLFPQVYDSRGDAVANRWAIGPSNSYSVIRTYDILGRLIEEVNFNPGAVNISPDLAEIRSVYTYDALGRMLHETRSNRQNTIMDMDYNFVSTPTGWDRTTTYPSGDGIIESADLNGRTFKSEIFIDGVSSVIHHNYTGDIYRGRKHDWSGRANGFSPDPMVFDRSLDGFGSPIEWKVNALEFQNNDPSNGPSNGNWADVYCDGYDPSRCKKPLMKISAIRDVLGRVRSVNTRFGHPMNNNGQQMDDELHENRWRGYTYAKRGFLKRAWEKDENAFSPVDTHTLIPNAITNADLNDVGNNNNAQPWDRLRDSAVGSLNQIVNNNSGEVRWQTGQRGDGHRLVEIEVDGENYNVVHDEIGRVRRTLDFVLEYDASNRLTAAHNSNTGAAEFYAYDGQGRLAYVYNSEQKTTQHFGYDGARMVVAMDKNYGILWQSFQGPDLDLILEFHDQNQALMPIIDHRKSISGAWDMSNGQMVGIATYDEEGRLALYSNDEALECNEVGNPGVNCSAPGGMPFGLNARWRSPMSGFVNMHHRWYSPRMGEFLSHDPLGYIDSYNLFGFATFDPINGYDPFGLANKGYVPTPPVDNVIKKGRRIPKGKISRTYDEFVNEMNDEDASTSDRMKAAVKRGLISHWRNLEDALIGLLNSKEDISRAAQTAGAKAAQSSIHHQNGDDLSAVGSGAEAVAKGIDAFGRTLNLLPKGLKLKVPRNAVLMDPQKIRFTQKSIGRSFKNGRPLRDLVKKLTTGKVTAKNLPPIRIFEKNGKIFTLDNRRLKAFQVAGKKIRTIRATAAEVRNEAWKMTTKDQGKTIKIRGGGL